MSTAFQAIQAGIVAALSAAPPLAGGNVQANQLRPIPSAQGSALVVRLSQAGGQQGVIGVLDWITVYNVECYVRSVSGVDPGLAVDALLGDAWSRLAAIDAAAIGASEVTLRPQIDWQFDDPGAPMVCAVLQLAVSHATTEATLQPRV